MTTQEIISSLKRQGLSNKEIMDLFRDHGRDGLEELAK